MPTRKNQPHRKLRRLQTALAGSKVIEAKMMRPGYLEAKQQAEDNTRAHIARLRPLARSA